MEHHDKITNATDFNKVYGGYPVATGTGFSLEDLNKFIKSWCGLNTKTVVSNIIHKYTSNKVYCILKNATLEEYEILTSFDGKIVASISQTGRKWYGFEKVAQYWDIYHFIQEIENEIEKKKREDDEKIKKEIMKQKYIEFCKHKQMLKSKHFTDDEMIELRKQFNCHF